MAWESNDRDDRAIGHVARSGSAAALDDHDEADGGERALVISNIASHWAGEKFSGRCWPSKFSRPKISSAGNPAIVIDLRMVFRRAEKRVRRNDPNFSARSLS